MLVQILAQSVLNSIEHVKENEINAKKKARKTLKKLSNGQKKIKTNADYYYFFIKSSASSEEN